MQWGVKSYCCIMQPGINLAAERQVKTFGRLPRPLKIQPRKKSYMGDLHYPSLMRIVYQNSPSLQFFFTPRWMMQRGVKLQIQITQQSWSKRQKDFRVWIGDSGGYFWWGKPWVKNLALLSLWLVHLKIPFLLVNLRVITFLISVIFLRAESVNHIILLYLEQRLLGNQKFHYI